MTYSELQVVLIVILEELNNDNLQSKSKINENKFDDTFDLTIVQKYTIEGIDSEKFNNGIQLLLEQREETKEWSNVNKIIFKGLVLVYNNSNQKERFCFFSKILTYFYNKLVQKLIEMQQPSQIISLEDFMNLVRNMLPFVKLEVLVQRVCLKSVDFVDLKEAIEEVFECLIYPKILREDCYQIIRNKLKKKEVDFLKFKVEQSHEKNGECSDYYKLSIDLEENHHVCTHKFFIKYLPENIDEIFMEITMSFAKEQKFYKSFIPMLEQLGYSKITDFAPKCFFTCKNLFLVFEDLSVKGYKNISMNEPWSQQQLSHILKQVSKLHSCTLLFEQKMAELLGYEIKINDYFSDMVAESAIGRDIKSAPISHAFIAGSHHLVQKYCKVLNTENTDQITKIALEKLQTKFDAMLPSTKYRNVINHGDLWANNIMLAEKSSEYIIVDFASIRWCPPACDFLILLFINTDKITRDRSALTLFNQYYLSTRSILNQHQINIKSVISRDEYLDFFKEYRIGVASMASGYLQLKLLEDVGDLTGGDSSLQDHCINPESRCKVLDKMWDQMKCNYRIEEIICEIIDFLSINCN
ncbi:uncharacterized protein LOC114335391 [Diabrotica virgifera virgifera]|uniref:CHK kinase-like domain-containing protein n=1 Tax=Diabrotica virgifera virgifera TaxID=50390 RepID=A0ABM5ITH4_DIAVI|nr:uncharacterized protein LOC114335391 [Diabrotica virgifera virgifera]